MINTTEIRPTTLSLEFEEIINKLDDLQYQLIKLTSDDLEVKKTLDNLISKLEVIKEESQDNDYTRKERICQ